MRHDDNIAPIRFGENAGEEDIHFYEPRQGHGLPHDPFNAIVGPRPIGWISSLSKTGVRNLAPYSFFNGFNYVPPIIGFSSVGWKDSVANIDATGEFVWNLVTRDLAVQMNQSSASVPGEVDEFVLAGLAAAPSRVIAAPRVAASPVSFECRKTQIIQLNDASGAPIESWIVLGEVVGVHINRSTLSNGVYQTACTQPVLRGGGPGDFFQIHDADRFFMPRPT